jgi:hypothetical protein
VSEVGIRAGAVEDDNINRSSRGACCLWGDGSVDGVAITGSLRVKDDIASRAEFGEGYRFIVLVGVRDFDAGSGVGLIPDVTDPDTSPGVPPPPSPSPSPSVSASALSVMVTSPAGADDPVNSLDNSSVKIAGSMWLYQYP